MGQTAGDVKSVQIYENGLFISCEDENRLFSVLVEDKGKIVYAGDRVPDVYSGSRSRINLDGKCVVPAFGDTHMHFESFSLFHSSLDIRAVRDFNELGDLIGTFCKNNPKENIILGFGCSSHSVKEGILPDRTVLDKITTLPLMLVKYDGHACVVNSSLMKQLPAIVLDDPGFDKHSGWLYQNAFYKGINSITKKVSPLKVFANLIKGADFLLKQGIGFIHTTEGVGFPLDIDVDIMRIAARGLPPSFRIYFQTMEIKKALRRKLPRIGGCFATALDGCFGSEDAALSIPYNNNQNNKGILFYSQQQVDEFVREANRAGLQVSLHAIGDAAVEQAITAYEKALRDFPRTDHRHIIIHADLIPVPLLERAAKIGLHFAVQTPFLYWEQEPMEYICNILGHRAENLIPLKSMIDYGLTIANGSDAPCTLPNPVEGIFAACNHPNPDQRIPVLDALRMHTNWAARLSFDEGSRGTLTEGKNADFAILDKNPLDLPPEKLKEINVLELYLKGKSSAGQSQNPLTLFISAVKNKLAGID
ncbi:MAG: amidohydrolase [Bacillota bacterium]